MSNFQVQSHTGLTHNADPYKWKSIGVLVLITITLPVILAIVVIAGPPSSDRVAHTAVAFLGAPSEQLSLGETVYMNTCKVCHGDKAQGVVGLGKPLVNNGYIQDSDDAELFNNIAVGRLPDHPLNTTGVMMPARGAQNISDEQINDVIVHLRSIQDPSAPRSSMDSWIIERSTAVVAFDGPGRDLYVALCSSCHGPNGEGMDGLGKSFIDSQFVKDSTDKEIIMLVKMGRPIWDPANTTGIDMPPKGGNPAMSDDDLNNIIEYIRSINGADNAQSSAPVVGRDFFVSMCSACHGPSGEGMEGLGKPFTTSNFIKESTDKEIATMVKMGRPIWDAANTTGVDMPPKGGNPAMSDDQLNDIITYIRSISTID